MKHYLQILLAILLLNSSGLLAQETWTKAKAIQVTKEAKTKVSNDQFKDALASLDESIAAVSGNGKLKSFHSYFLFTKAYLYENKIDGTPEKNLTMAQGYYDQSLALQPGELKILKNLILVSKKLNDDNNLVKYCELAYKNDPSEERGKWFTLLGNYFKNNKQSRDPDLAYKYYERSLDAGTGNREAAQQLIDLYQFSMPEYINKYFGTCKKMYESGLSETAAMGLLNVFNLTCNENGAVSEDMMLYWAGIIIKNNWARPRMDKFLSKISCSIPAIDQLKVNFSQNWQIKLPQTNWWKANPRRTFYYYAMQKSWGDHILSKGNKERAAKLYSTSRRYTQGNDYSKEIYGKSDVLEIDLLVQLARLYNDKSIDPDGRKFESLESSLYGGKGSAYRSGNLEAIQKFHTILGLIYVDRKQWSGGAYTNAQFQLKRAITTADKRALKNPIEFTPLPHLHKYLGQTYDALGKTDQAADAYLNAALAYMETDNLQLTKEMLTTADSNIKKVDNPMIAEKKQDVEALYVLRTKVEKFDSNNFNPSNSNYFQNLIDPNTINQNGTIQPAILKRQYSKILMDLETPAINSDIQIDQIQLLKAAEFKFESQTVKDIKFNNQQKLNKTNGQQMMQQQQSNGPILEQIKN